MGCIFDCILEIVECRLRIRGLDCGREFEELSAATNSPACPQCGKRRLERRNERRLRATSPARRLPPGPAATVCSSSHGCGPNCGLHG